MASSMGLFKNRREMNSISSHGLIPSSWNWPSRTLVGKILEPYLTYLEIMLRLRKINSGNKEGKVGTPVIYL